MSGFDLDLVEAMCRDLVRDLEPIAAGSDDRARSARFVLALQRTYIELLAREINAGGAPEAVVDAVLSVAASIVGSLVQTISQDDREMYEQLVAEFSLALERKLHSAPALVRRMEVMLGGRA